MRIAVLSDIHSNLYALSAVVEDIETLRVDAVWFLGDLFGYAPFAVQVHSILRETLKPTVWLAGNHDLALNGSKPCFEMMTEAGQQVIHKQRRILPVDVSGNIAQKPVQQSVSGMRDLPDHLFYAAHGFPAADMLNSVRQYDGRLAPNGNFGQNSLEISQRHQSICPESGIWLLGHSHQQKCWILNSSTQLWKMGTKGFGQGLNGEKGCFLPKGNAGVELAHAQLALDDFTKGGLAIINPGSVGFPRDGGYRAIDRFNVAKYLLMAYSGDMLDLYFRAVPYDASALSAALKEANYPERIIGFLKF
jgi:predicted phosphodiesterase